MAPAPASSVVNRVDDRLRPPVDLMKKSDNRGKK
jgi:hypothetical protein